MFVLHTKLRDICMRTNWVGRCMCTKQVGRCIPYEAGKVDVFLKKWVDRSWTTYITWTEHSQILSFEVYHKWPILSLVELDKNNFFSILLFFST